MSSIHVYGYWSCFINILEGITFNHCVPIQFHLMPWLGEREGGREVCLNRKSFWTKCWQFQLRYKTMIEVCITVVWPNYLAQKYFKNVFWKTSHSGNNWLQHSQTAPVAYVRFLAGGWIYPSSDQMGVGSKVCRDKYLDSCFWHLELIMRV